MIVITGATGALNGSTTDHLLDRTPAERIAVVARDPARARRFADRGVEVRYGDYADPASLDAAFSDAEQLLLVSSNDPHADAVSLHREAIRAAQRAGVGRILYTSHQGAGVGSPFAPATVHAATEQALAESGLPWTSLRNGFYAHSLQWLLGPWQRSGAVVVPADGPVSWTSREDAAEAAASIIAGETRWDGPVTITASAAPTFEEVAAIAAEVSGSSVGFDVQEPESWLAAQVDSGQPEGMARFSLGMYEAAAAGWFETIDPTLRELLGREPRTVRDQLESMATAAEAPPTV